MVRASVAMAVTQPAVSYLISSLEKTVGFPLFSRKGGKLIATPEAHQLLAEVDKVYQGLEDIESAARQIANHERAVIRILITQALAAGRVIKGIGRFVLQHPGIHLDIDVAHRTAIMHRISSGQADLGILSLPLSVTGAIGTNLFNSELLCVSSASGFLDGKRKVRPASLSDVPIIALKPTSSIRPQVENWFAGAGIRPVYKIEVGDSGTAIELVRSGLGITIVSSVSIPVGRDSGLLAVPLHPAVHVQIGTVVPTTQSPNRAVRALVEFLRADHPK